ncbi:glycosyltransferase family 2 protein [Frankia sp. B2]|uniref:glycosyltransferase family 2 protein n=1 Tax=Frankia sp. B2 TaxID=2541730 RepID=UPI00106D7E7B|nr:glycosyltransferase family 2 protein [Frankia sp. B2]TFE30470.1 glycosyltransferase family 2 protein [Frankia sp. B2]
MGVDVSILIVSYNTGAMTAACLESCAATSDGLATEMIVLDNASTDDSVSIIRDRFPSVNLIEQRTNLGFGRAVNLAASQAKGEYLLLLNPDTVVLPGAVANLLDFARANPRHGIYGGRTLGPDHTVDPRSCWAVPTVWSHVCFGLGLSTAFRRSALFDPESMGPWPRDTVRTVGVVTGCLLLIPRALFEQLGGFDSRFFMYGEDVDLSIRARRAGLDPVITPAAVVVHHGGASSAGWADKHVLVMTGKVTLARTHWTGWRRTVCLAMLVLGVALRAALATVIGRPAGTGSGGWRVVWTRQADWRAGYPPLPPA